MPDSRSCEKAKVSWSLRSALLAIVHAQLSWCLILPAYPAIADARPLHTGLTARELGVVVNEVDPLSVQIGEYYRVRRSIPAENIVRVRFEAAGAALSSAEFTGIKARVDKALPVRVQALALTWAEPFRVECMSITSAFAFGFSRKRCAEGCTSTPYSPYFDSDSRAPHSDFAFRPAMSLAALDLGKARELIDRGVASDGARPRGSAYLLETDDKARSARAPWFPLARDFVDQRLRVEILKANAIVDRRDVLFYFTGVAQVADLSTIRFLGGAIADHLTSYGGVLVGSSQMSSLRWLEAGATGSYGTVVEPCAIPGKFPSPLVAMKHYLAGETLIEAYWKSVAMPSQGIFVGEPLAAPFAARKAPRRVH